MPQYTSNINLYKPNRLDTDLEIDLTLAENFEKIDAFAGNVGAELEEGLSNALTKAQEKEFDLSKASASYLYDLELSNTTINQFIVFDETAKEIYATQVYNTSGDSLEGFRISRVTEGGTLLSHMNLRQGGHGTTIGIERENGKVYIWSNLIVANSTGGIGTQWLCRYPYLPGETITIADSRVQRVLEFPIAAQYMTPLSDMKNGLLAIRHTNNLGNGNVATRVEVHTYANVKAGVFNAPLYTYHWTAEMNVGTLQGLAFDGHMLYVTLGQIADDFHLLAIDMRNGQTVAQWKQPTGKTYANAYVEDFGEPEGLALYTDPNTGFKTLFTVIVGDEANRRRNRLFAFSNNAGVNKFFGYALDRTQQFPLIRNDGKSKRINMAKITALSQIVESGDYYMTAEEADQLTDHPMKGVGGWWLYVSGTNPNGGVNQTLVRNSSGEITVAYRIVFSAGNAGSWWKQALTQM
ncbi:hypothetical protein [Planomicrobium sp. CPCC 101079]|uniref:phage baseplate protein n=1 Tax=Planomicrobium sp. CPCC 101079 TaxID=2599618 RepID=UPI0011B4C698|nr:hypothetical protein [Planomicrobium sp. CPCC 101079]TWT04597.1 hypothetical protein FQV28_08315 [Planomicrobium sp. CPCC 101079]